MSEELFMVMDDTKNEIGVDEVDLADLPPEMRAALDAAMFPEFHTDQAA